jgi:hypothetical protein
MEVFRLSLRWSRKAKSARPISIIVQVEGSGVAPGGSEIVPTELWLPLNRST